MFMPLIPFLLIGYVLLAAFWAGFRAYQRKAIQRLWILITAISLPVLAAVGMLGAYSTFGSFQLSPGLFRVSLLAVLAVYLFGSISTIIWADRGKSAIETRGFPIEPINSVAPNDSDPV